MAMRAVWRVLMGAEVVGLGGQALKWGSDTLSGGLCGGGAGVGMCPYLGVDDHTVKVVRVRMCIKDR